MIERQGQGQTMMMMVHFLLLLGDMGVDMIDNLHCLDGHFLLSVRTIPSTYEIELCLMATMGWWWPAISLFIKNGTELSFFHICGGCLGALSLSLMAEAPRAGANITEAIWNYDDS